MSTTVRVPASLLQSAAGQPTPELVSHLHSALQRALEDSGADAVKELKWCDPALGLGCGCRRVRGYGGRELALRLGCGCRRGQGYGGRELALGPGCGCRRVQGYGGRELALGLGRDRFVAEGFGKRQPARARSRERVKRPRVHRAGGYPGWGGRASL
jgi:hypothetical protein